MTKRLSDSKVSSMLIGDYIPDGATVTPVDDYAIWLRCAGLPNTYGSLVNVIADTTAMETLCNNINALRYMVRSEDVIAPAVLGDADWISELKLSTYAITVPTMVSDTTPSGVCSAKNLHAGHLAYKYFDKNDASGAHSSAVTDTDYWGQYQFAISAYMFCGDVICSTGQGNSLPYLTEKAMYYNGTSFADASASIQAMRNSALGQGFISERTTIPFNGFYYTDQLRMVNVGSVGSYPGFREINFYGLDLS